MPSPNADWGKAEHLLEVDELRVRARIGELLSGDVVLPEIAVDGLRLNLARNAEGAANWMFSGSRDTGAAGLPLVPVIENLQANDVSIGYTDEALDLDLEATLASLSGQATADGVRLSGEGRLAGEPLQLTLDAAPLDRLDASDQPYPLHVAVGVGDTKLAADGTITNPLAFAGADIALTASGTDLATLGLGTFPCRRLRPIVSRRGCESSGETWRLEGAKVDLGETQALGWAEVSLAQEVTHNCAPTSSCHTYATRIWCRSRMKRRRPDGRHSGRLFPDQPLPTAWLEQGSGVVHVRIEENDLPVVPVNSIDVRLTLRDGRLESESAHHWRRGRQVDRRGCAQRAWSDAVRRSGPLLRGTCDSRRRHAAPASPTRPRAPFTAIFTFWVWARACSS